jgi:hypothetical protein
MTSQYSIVSCPSRSSYEGSWPLFDLRTVHRECLVARAQPMSYFLIRDVSAVCPYQIHTPTSVSLNSQSL